MANEYSLTPGAGMADMLQGFITRDRNLQRQAMLDELNRRKTEADIENQRINAEAMKTYRDAYAQELKSRAEQNTVENFDKGMFGIGTDMAGRFDPDVQKTLTKAGRITTTNPNAYKGNEEAYAEGVYSAGSPVERERERRKSAILSLAETIDDPSVVARLSAIAELDNNITGSELTNVFRPETKPVYRTKLDGTIEKVGDVPFNAQMTQVDRIPPGPQGPAPQLIQVPDPNNPGKFFSGWVKPGDEEGLRKLMEGAQPPPPPGPTSPALVDRQGPPIPGQQPQGPVSGLPVYKGNVPASSQRAPSRITSGETSGMRAALSQFARAQSGAAGTNPQMAQQALFATQNQIINKYLPSNDLKEAARAILSDPDRDKVPVQVLIDRIRDDNGMPLPADAKEAMSDVLSSILGRY